MHSVVQFARKALARLSVWHRSRLADLAAQEISRAALALPLLLTAQGSCAGPITVNQSFGLEVRFSVPQTLVITNPDLVFFGFDNLFINDPVVSHTASLYDGSLLLGSVSNTLGGNQTGRANLEGGGFKSAASIYLGGPARSALIDFSSVLDGTIEGRLLFTIQQGSFVFDDESSLFARVGRAIGSGMFVSTELDGPVIESISRYRVAPVPVPGSLGLLCVGLMGLLAMRASSSSTSRW